ncbi:hypothetical protein MTO96_042992 [Rhipicephalus appendiculatus]
MNESKSKALLFGSFPKDLIGRIEVAAAVKVVGIYFTCEGVAATTWHKALERARQLAERARLMDLTLREKALAVKTEICAFAFYASRVATMPKKTATQINKIVNTLLWDGKPAPVRRNLLQLPENEGGG